MRTHEIVGPEVTQVTGQLRIPKDIAIAKHIAQFWNPPGFLASQAEESKRQHAAEIKLEDEISNAAGISYERLVSYSPAQQSLLWALHRSGNDEVTWHIAHDIRLTESQSIIKDLMIKAVALDIYKKNIAFKYASKGIDNKKLTATLKEIVKTNADWPNSSDKWERKLQVDLRELTWIPPHGWESGFGPDSPAHWEIRSKD